jgi:hypothetical protein
MPIPNLMKIDPVILDLKHGDEHNQPDACYFMHNLQREHKNHKIFRDESHL